MSEREEEIKIEIPKTLSNTIKIENKIKIKKEEKNSIHPLSKQPIDLKIIPSNPNSTTIFLEKDTKEIAKKERNISRKIDLNFSLFFSTQS